MRRIRWAMVMGEQGREASNKEAAGTLGIEAIKIFCARRLKVEPPKEFFGGSGSLPRTGISDGPTTAQPQKRASTPDIRKLSYRDENKKILDSCMWRARSDGERGGRKVIRGWGDLVGRPEPMTREDQVGFLSRKARRVLRRRGRFF